MQDAVLRFVRELGGPLDCKGRAHLPVSLRETCALGQTPDPATLQAVIAKMAIKEATD